MTPAQSAFKQPRTQQKAAFCRLSRAFVRRTNGSLVLTPPRQGRRTDSTHDAATVCRAAATSGDSAWRAPSTPYDMPTPWLLGTIKQSVSHPGAWLAGWLTWLCQTIASGIVLATTAFTFFNQDKLAVVLGGQTNVFFLFLYTILLFGGVAASSVFHDYENWTYGECAAGADVDRGSKTNGWLLIVAVRSLATHLTFSLLAFAAAVYGLTTPIIAAIAVCTVVVLGPTHPIIAPVVNGQRVGWFPVTVLIAAQVAQVAYGLALWKLLGMAGVALLVPLNAALACESLVQATQNQWPHVLSHLSAVVHGGAKLYLLTRLIV